MGNDNCKSVRLYSTEELYNEISKVQNKCLIRNINNNECICLYNYAINAWIKFEIRYYNRLERLIDKAMEACMEDNDELGYIQCFFNYRKISSENTKIVSFIIQQYLNKIGIKPKYKKIYYNYVNSIKILVDYQNSNIDPVANKILLDNQIPNDEKHPTIIYLLKTLQLLNSVNAAYQSLIMPTRKYQKK